MGRGRSEEKGVMRGEVGVSKEEEENFSVLVIIAD